MQILVKARQDDLAQALRFVADKEQWRLERENKKLRRTLRRIRALAGEVAGE